MHDLFSINNTLGLVDGQVVLIKKKFQLGFLFFVVVTLMNDCSGNELAYMKRGSLNSQSFAVFSTSHSLTFDSKLVVRSIQTRNKDV